MTHRVIKRPFEQLQDENKKPEESVKRQRANDLVASIAENRDRLAKLLAESNGLRSVSGLFVEPLFGKQFVRVSLYKTECRHEPDYSRNHFACLGIAVLHANYTPKLRKALYKHGIRTDALNEEFRRKVNLLPHTMWLMAHFSVSVLLNPPLICPDPSLQPEFSMASVLSESAYLHAHERHAYFASLLGDSETPTVVKGTAINAHAATLSLLQSTFLAREHAGPAPRFCKPRMFGSWMETVFVDMLPADVIDHIRDYLRVLPRQQPAAGLPQWTLDCALATGVSFARSDSMTYERVVEQSNELLPLEPSAWWWHRVLVDPKPLPTFGHVARLGGAAPHCFRLALRLHRHPEQFGITKRQAATLTSFSRVYSAMLLGHKLLVQFQPSSNSSAEYRREFNIQLGFVAWVLCSYLSVCMHMCEFYTMSGMGRNADAIFDAMQERLRYRQLTVFMPREEVAKLVLQDIDHGVWPATYSVKPNALGNGRFPSLASFFNTPGVTIAQVLLHPRASEAMFKALKRAQYGEGKCNLWPVVASNGNISLSREWKSAKEYLSELTVSPSWKPSACGVCRNCVTRVENLSTSECLAPMYLPIGPLRAPPRSLGQMRLLSFRLRFERDVLSVKNKVMSIMHPLARFIKDSHDFWTDMNSYQIYDRRRPGTVFQDIYRFRAYSGQNTTPHNHFIDGGSFVASLFEDEGTWLNRAKSLDFHLPISHATDQRSFSHFDFLSTKSPNVGDVISDGLCTNSARRAFALQTVCPDTSTNAPDLLVLRTFQFRKVLEELESVTLPIYVALSTGLTYAHSEVLDGLRVPGEYPFDCFGDQRRGAYAKEANERDLPLTRFESACRPHPGATPFGSLAFDFGLPVRRADSKCQHVYQFHFNVCVNKLAGPKDRCISFSISTSGHTTIKRVFLRRRVGESLFAERVLMKSATNPPRKYDSTGIVSLFEAVHVNTLHVKNRKWVTETDLSETAVRAIFAPDRKLSHEWEALAWTADLRGYTLYDAIDPVTGFHQLVDAFHLDRGTLNSNVMDADTQDDSVECDFME
ncbi:hypothetical protein [Yaravirus sp. 'brasiliensis']|uniref:Uncharacterized protein n=1 Tax=Yaravirus sp. 'brasiliensis' TaxID=2739681 RepID=A0AAE7E350_9VIRU|nr:hypothetical protein QKS73_gp39 [Yaravirus brasiliensis]QKE44438.1 hypothetical protein [Yaravirus brasiliensis]